MAGKVTLEKRVRELERVAEAARDISECFTEEGVLEQTVLDETLHRKVAKLRKVLVSPEKPDSDLKRDKTKGDGR